MGFAVRQGARFFCGAQGKVYCEARNKDCFGARARFALGQCAIFFCGS